MLPFSYPTSADEWQNIGLGLTVVAFSVAFALAAGNAILNWKINKTKREESRKKDEKIALEFKAKEVLIANADKRAAEANAEAARANEGLAKSNEEIARLIAETEQAKLERAEADKQIARAKAEAANAAQRTAEVSLKVEEEARKRAEAERALLELQERVKPRHLTPEQQEKFISVLKQFPKVTVAMYCGDPEACNFAKQLAAAFRAAGWDDLQGGEGNTLYAFSPPIIGILVTRKDRDPIPPSYMALHSALIAAEVEHKFGYNETIAAGLIEIRIGVKP